MRANNRFPRRRCRSSDYENEVELTQLNTQADCSHRRAPFLNEIRQPRDGNPIRIIISHAASQPGLKIHNIPAESFCCCASGSSSGFDSAAFMIPPHYSSLLYNFLSILRSLRQRSACTHNLGRFLCCRISLLTFLPPPSSSPSIIHPPYAENA